MNRYCMWIGSPKTFHQAKMAVIGKYCIVCGCPALLAILRPPIPNWLVHCNHCSTEMPIAVLLNRKALKEQNL